MRASGRAGAPPPTALSQAPPHPPRPGGVASAPPPQDRVSRAPGAPSQPEGLLPSPPRRTKGQWGGRAALPVSPLPLDSWGSPWAGIPREEANDGGRAGPSCPVPKAAHFIWAGSCLPEMGRGPPLAAHAPSEAEDRTPTLWCLPSAAPPAPPPARTPFSTPHHAAPTPLQLLAAELSCACRPLFIQAGTPPGQRGRPGGGAQLPGPTRLAPEEAAQAPGSGTSWPPVQARGLGWRGVHRAIAWCRCESACAAVRSAQPLNPQAPSPIPLDRASSAILCEGILGWELEGRILGNGLHPAPRPPGTGGACPWECDLGRVFARPSVRRVRRPWEGTCRAACGQVVLGGPCPRKAP